MAQDKSQTPARTKQKIWLKFLVPAFSLVASLLAVELALRLLVPASSRWTAEDQLRLIEDGTRRYPPGRSLFSTFCKDRPRLPHEARPVLETSLREYDYPQVKPQGTTRIIGLGDSFAWGWGMHDNRRTFFKLLECWWNRENPSRPVEVINASKPGAGVGYYQGFMDLFGWRLNPDRVILSFNLNDARIPFVSLSVDAKTARRLEERSGFWTRNSRLIRLVRTRLLRKQVERNFIANVHDGYLGVKRSECWGQTQAILLALANGCKQRGIGLLVVVFPLLVDLERHYPFAAEVEEIVRFFRENGIDCVNLLPAFLGKKPNLLWTRPVDTHPNEVANRLAAEAIFPAFSHPGFIAAHGK